MRHHLLVALALLGIASIATAAEPPAAPSAPAAPPAAKVVWDHYFVRSPATGKIERFWVGRPETLKADGRYPVVYFLPGLLDSENHWKEALGPHLGRYERIAVCTAVGGGTWVMNSPRQPWMKWSDFLTDELRPFVEAHYPASRAKGQRGIVGISAGGHGAIYNALQRPDLYGAVSVLSGAMELRGYAGSVGLDLWVGPRTAEALPLYEERSILARLSKADGPLPFDLHLEAGDKDGALPQMQALRPLLDRRHVAYDWNVAPGSHDWTLWKQCTPGQLAWFDKAFARNREENRFPDEPPPVTAAPFEVIQGSPDVALSDEAVRRLRAAWQTEGGRRLSVSGLAPEGAPLSAADPAKKAVTLRSTDLDAQGHEAALHLYRLTVTAGTPFETGGPITLTLRILNGRGAGLISLPPAALMLPPGPRDRRTELHARVALEFQSPDPLRGGIVCGLQVFDAEGKPVGDPIVGKALPGSANVEGWPVAPKAGAMWTFTLPDGDKGLGLAAIYDVRLEVETTAP